MLPSSSAAGPTTGGRAASRGELDVVVSHDRHVGRDAKAVRREALEEAQRDQIVAGEHGRRSHLRIEGRELVRGLPTGSDGQAGCRHGQQRRVGGTPRAPRPRDPHRRQRVQEVWLLAGRGDQHAAYALFLEEVEVSTLALGVAGAVAREHDAAVLEDRVLDTPCDVGEERVRCVDHHEADRATGAGAELAGGLVVDVPERLDGRAHARQGGIGDQVRAVQHVGDGPHGHPSRGSDLLARMHR